ncbi:putative 2-phosphosulfolactate phosphatase [Clostridia bacterium]|nr:putative 2-phosphosulfolactate phosphatase [Clostridia bacterium]
MRIITFPTADAVIPYELTGQTGLTLVIDALRMTSVAIAALGNGCARLCAVETVEEARVLAPQYNALLGGERNTVRIDGFEFGNSPSEYTTEKIAGRSLIVTTTNGTRAIAKANPTGEVWLAAFLNARAIAERILSETFDNITIICAGTLGRFTMEDALVAGAILIKLDGHDELDDFSLACIELYQSSRDNLLEFISKTEHAKRLVRLGFSGDLEYCLREDVSNVIPKLNNSGWFTS